MRRLRGQAWRRVGTSLEHFCGLCTLFKGLEATKDTTLADTELYAAHLRITHGLKPYVIEP